MPEENRTAAAAPHGNRLAYVVAPMNENGCTSYCACVRQPYPIMMSSL
jgi:hypothetical protein